MFPLQTLDETLIPINKIHRSTTMEMGSGNYILVRYLWINLVSHYGKNDEISIGITEILAEEDKEGFESPQLLLLCAPDPRICGWTPFLHP